MANLSQPWDLTLDTRITNYREWTKRRFRKDSPTTLTSPGSDPDKDQKINLLEYFSGTDPFVFGKKEIVSLIKSDPYMQLTYTMINQPIVDIKVSIESSEDIVNWTVNPQDIKELGSSAFEGSVLINHRFNYQGEKKKGAQIRLRITLIDP